MSEAQEDSMGYCNKRKRTKRRRTRSLNSFKINANTKQSPASSDDSWLETFEQSSSCTSFCSTYSHHSYMSSDNPVIPSSVFLDVVNNLTLFHDDLNNDTAIQGSADEMFSSDDREKDHDVMSFPDIAPEESSLNEVDDDSAQSTTSSYLDTTNGSPCHNSDHGQYLPHAFDQVTRDETASYKIMSLLDSSGAPRICYDRLIALLKKLSKNDGFDVKKAINRETLMRRLANKCKTRPRLQRSVINKQEVIRFRFHDMLQDLVNNSSQYLQEISPHYEDNKLPH